MLVRLFVGNLLWGLEGPDLDEIFQQFGTVVSAVVDTDPETGRSNGHGIVEMDVEDVGSVIAAANGMVLTVSDGTSRQIRVTLVK